MSEKIRKLTFSGVSESENKTERRKLSVKSFKRMFLN